MIEGFKLRVSHTELAAHCNKRAAHHVKRANEKEQELPALRDALERMKGHAQTLPTSTQSGTGCGGFVNSGYNVGDPVKDLQNDIREHRRKADTFTFFAEHLIADDYSLSEADAYHLEMVRR